MSVLRWNRLIAALAFVLIVVLSFGPVSADGQTHVVQPGENLFRIALSYGVSVDALAAANGIIVRDGALPRQHPVEARAVGHSGHRVGLPRGSQHHRGF